MNDEIKLMMLPALAWKWHINLPTLTKGAADQLGQYVESTGVKQVSLQSIVDIIDWQATKAYKDKVTVHKKISIAVAMHYTPKIISHLFNVHVQTVYARRTQLRRRGLVPLSALELADLLLYREESYVDVNAGIPLMPEDTNAVEHARKMPAFVREKAVADYRNGLTSRHPDTTTGSGEARETREDDDSAYFVEEIEQKCEPSAQTEKKIANQIKEVEQLVSTVDDDEIASIDDLPLGALLKETDIFTDEDDAFGINDTEYEVIEYEDEAENVEVEEL